MTPKVHLLSTYQQMFPVFYCQHFVLSHTPSAAAASPAVSWCRCSSSSTAVGPWAPNLPVLQSVCVLPCSRQLQFRWLFDCKSSFHKSTFEIKLSNQTFSPNQTLLNLVIIVCVLRMACRQINYQINDVMNDGKVGHIIATCHFVRKEDVFFLIIKNIIKTWLNLRFFLQKYRKC